MGIYFALGGHEQAIRFAKQIVTAFNGQSFIILDQDGPYHAAACIVSNYFVSLIHWATQIYAEFGIRLSKPPPPLPLIQGTVNNLQQLGPTQALTGPISRGDGITIATHLSALDNINEKNLYAELGLYTLGVALKRHC